MSAQIELYDRDTISGFNWPDTDNGRYAKRFLLPMLEQSPHVFVGNVRTRLVIMVIDDIVLPVSVNDGEYDNSYVCSPYTHYVSYAKQELALLGNRAAESILSGLLTGIGWLLRRGRINRTVQINNWLFSTNLYPRLEERHLQAIVAFLNSKFPDHSLIFRSLDTTTNSRMQEALRHIGCIMVPSRQIYFLHPGNPKSMNVKARWLVKRDRALLDKHGYEAVGADKLTERDIPRIVELYNALYLHKYSFHNPHFTEKLIGLALNTGILRLHALRKEGRIDAVLGYYCRDGVMTTPLFGYDTSLPQETGLYRMLSATLLEIAEGNGHLLHESSGAAQFKRNRGAFADMEYSAVYCRHLPVGRRMCWSGLAAVLERLGVPIMRKLKL